MTSSQHEPSKSYIKTAQNSPQHKTGSTQTDAINPGVPVSERRQESPAGQANQPPKKDAQKEHDNQQQKTGTKH